MPQFRYDGQTFETGDFVVCEIEGVPIENARIFVYDSNSAIICQNDKDGDRAPDDLGFRYGWSFGKDGKRLSCDVKNLRHAPPRYAPREQISEYKTNLLKTEDGGMLRVRR